MHLRTLHPQFMGARLLWRPGTKEAELFFIEHSMREEPRFRHSPVWALYEGAEGIRQRLDLPAGASGDEYGIYADLRAEGFTDYVALPVQFTDGKRHATSWAPTGRAASPPPIWSRSTTRCRCWRWRPRSA